MILGLAALAACTASEPPAGVDPDGPEPSAPDATAPPAPTELAFDTPEDTAITFGFDARDADGGVLAVQTRPPLHGAVVCDGVTCTYTPRANYHGRDELAAAMGVGDHQAVTAITIDVGSVNDAPEPEADTFSMVADSELHLTPGWLVDNDKDVDGDVLVVTAVGSAKHGVVTLAGGEVSFVADSDFIGDGEFDYVVSDGTAAVLGHVTVGVAR